MRSPGPHWRQDASGRYKAKRRFRTELGAVNALRRLPGAEARWRAYECDLCGGWHLTHKSGRGSAATG